MKNSKKCDFKKLALLGISGGVMLATQAVEAEILNTSELLATNACGGFSGCGGSKSMGANNGSQAYRNIPSQDAYYYNDGQQPYASCGGATPQYYQSTASCGGAAPQYYQSGQQYYQSSPQHYQSSPQYYQPTSYPSTPGYSTNHSQQWDSMTQTYQASSQPSQGGCGGNSPSKGQQTSEPMTSNAPASDSTSWTQWETADNAKAMNKGAMQQESSPTIQIDRTTTKTAPKQLTESDLLSQLNEEGKKTYNSLDAAGKALALKMASQDTFKDKNLAVKAAALKMSERRATPASSKY